MRRERPIRLLRPALAAASWVALSMLACQAPEEYYRDPNPGMGQGGVAITFYESTN